MNQAEECSQYEIESQAIVTADPEGVEVNRAIL